MVVYNTDQVTWVKERQGGCAARTEWERLAGQRKATRLSPTVRREAATYR